MSDDQMLSYVRGWSDERRPDADSASPTCSASPDPRAASTGLSSRLVQQSGKRGSKLLRLDRLGEELGAAGVQRGNPIVGHVPGGKHDDACVRQALLRT